MIIPIRIDPEENDPFWGSTVIVKLKLLSFFCSTELEM